MRAIIRWVVGGIVGIVVLGVIIGAACTSGFGVFDNENEETTATANGGQPGATNGGVCRLDKVGTWSEGNNPHRIEVGGHGGQHLDFYPQVGMKSVSYVVANIPNPDGVPSIAWGFGSLWEGDTPECQTFNWVQDATAYARARLDSGHSGLVVRWGTWEVLENVAGLSQSQVDSLIAQHRQAFGERTAVAPAQAPQSQTQASSPPPAPQQAPAEGCPPAQELTYATPANVSVNGPAIVHPWWNNGKPSFGQTQVKIKLEPGQGVTFLQMMGKVYMYQDSPACRANLDGEFGNASFPVRTIVELAGQGLVQ